MKAMTDLMSELDTILRMHAVRYSLMEPADAVKLIYQNEFGGGHLIRDEEACLNYLRREYAGIIKDPGTPLYEEIGNGLVRIHLAAVKEENLEQLGEHFIRSAAEHTGTREAFLQKLNILRQLTSEGVFAFDAKKLEDYLSEYALAGYPMVSHSEAYRQNYGPAYRILCSAYIRKFMGG